MTGPPRGPGDRGPSGVRIRHPRCTTVVGEFDGMHLGHRALVSAAASVARQRREPLVGVVLDDVRARDHLLPLDVRMRRLLALGCGAAVSVPVDTTELGADGVGAPGAAIGVVARIAELTWATTAVLACLPTRDVPPRFPSLRDGFRAAGIEVVEVDRCLDADGSPITSSRIRWAVCCGAMTSAAAHLGRAYAVSGEVVRGAGLGRTIGFPTANVPPPPGVVIPAHGVYTGRVDVPGAGTYPAAINVGRRPTVTGGAGPVLVEAHLVDVDLDLYDVPITVEFHRRLRPERRFDSIDALIAQLTLDVAAARG